MSDVLINGVYPVSYFTLPGIDQIQYPDTFWWSSTSRFASVDETGSNYLAADKGGALTSEILEIDLGRIREINFLNFDVLRAPINISVQYDAISTPDRQAVWLPVKAQEGLLHDDYISYDASNRTAWQNAEFNFTDAKGYIIHTRYVRLVFTRRDDAWPTSTSAKFEWPLFVKHLRLGRYVNTLRDTVGPLLVQDTPVDLDEVTLSSQDGYTSREARQRFVYPGNADRAGVTPNMLGFGILVQTSPYLLEFDQSGSGNDTSVQFAWELWDLTDALAPLKLRSGVEVGVISPGLSWLDFYLDDKLAVEGDLSKVYELRVSSRDVSACDIVFTHSPNQLSSRTIPGTLTFTNGGFSIGTSVDTTSVVAVGDYIVRQDVPDQVFYVDGVDSVSITLNVGYSGTTTSLATGAVIYPYSSYNVGTGQYVLDPERNLVMRVWADVADEGRDVLGNAYRYTTHREKAKYVHDNTRAGWMSEPAPTPEAVESLYFDLRGTDVEGERIPTLIEAINIAPRTPGVRMNVYWTQQGTSGDAPKILNDWDYMLWTPIQETYTLRRNETIEFPQPIKASFIKLEFSSLNPLPFNIPDFPRLAPRVYRRFPTWVEDQFNNSTIRNTVEDWFLRNATPVQTKILAGLRTPIKEFEYKQKEFLAALALGKIKANQLISAGLVDIADKALVDPITASRVYIQGTDQFQSSLLISVDQDSILGKLVVERFDPNILSDPVELPAESVFDNIGTVSTINDRISESYQNLAQVPMRFNRTARHLYTYEQAEFNKKAYFVGIDEVRFLRNNYTISRDDELIVDILYDEEMLQENTWDRATGTTIEDGAELYVSYQVNPDITDELVFFGGYIPSPLSETGFPARNILVYSRPDKQGNQFFQTDDYDISYTYDDDGRIVTNIARSRLAERLTTSLQDVIYVDAATVVAQGVIPSPPTDDEGVVVGTGTPITDEFEGPFMPNYGTGTYGGGVFGNLQSTLDDAATSSGHGVPSAVIDNFATDTATIIGIGVVTALDVGPTNDSNTAIGVGVVNDTLEENFDPVDANTVIGIGLPTAAEQHNKAVPVTGLTSTAAFGVPRFNTTVPVPGLTSTPSFAVMRFNVTVPIPGLGSAASFGSVYIKRTVNMTGLNSAASFGSVHGPVMVAALTSTASFGSVKVSNTARPAGLTGTPSYGTVTINSTTPVTGLGSAAAFGTVTA